MNLFILALVCAAMAMIACGLTAVSSMKQRRTATEHASGATPPGRFSSANDELIEHVNGLLPQTQCAQCGYPGCRPYAEAIIEQDIPINRCPPGGDDLIVELAQFLGTEPVPLDTGHGKSKPTQLARIHEVDCIGCTLCLPACPVDAIVGASKQMHTIISEQCTGCELCLAPCPVDCIELYTPAEPLHQWSWPKPQNDKNSNRALMRII